MVWMFYNVVKRHTFLKKKEICSDLSLSIYWQVFQNLKNNPYIIWEYPESELLMSKDPCKRNKNIWWDPKFATCLNSCHYIYIHYWAINFMDRKYISIKEASKMLGVTPLTLRNWDKRGILTAYRNPINNYRVYRLDQVELFQRRIENSKNKSRGRRIDISIS